MPREMVELIEGLALGAAAVADREVHRTSTKVARERGWPVSSYAVVRLIVVGMDRGLLALAHHGPDAYRDGYELVLRREPCVGRRPASRRCTAAAPSRTTGTYSAAQDPTPASLSCPSGRQ